MPVGPDNGFDLLGRRPRPTDAFPAAPQPVRVQGARCPKDFGNKELVWTLKTQRRHREGVRVAAAGLLHRRRRDRLRDRRARAPARAIRRCARTSRRSCSSKARKTHRSRSASRFSSDGRRHRRRHPEGGAGQGAPDADPGAAGPPHMMPPSAIDRRQMARTAPVLVRLSRPRQGRPSIPFRSRRGRTRGRARTRRGRRSGSAPPLPDGGKYVVNAVFDTPGTYLLRARADDGALSGRRGVDRYRHPLESIGAAMPRQRAASRLG